MRDRCDLMLRCLNEGDPVYLSSEMWTILGGAHYERLAPEHAREFKRTLGLAYFTWLPRPWDSQSRFLLRHTAPRDLLRSLPRLSWRGVSMQTARLQTVWLVLFTRLLWLYARRHDELGLLDNIEEPAVGHPFEIRLGGRLISQDLANSALEFYSIREHFRPEGRASVCELGAGYGRLAYLFLKAADCRYTVIDIPPALAVSEHYLSAVFPEKRVFRFRPFGSYEEVREEFEAADIRFLLPHQAETLPARSFDLFVNVSSLHEMTRGQVAAYLEMAARLTRGFFYSKQWWEGRNAHDGAIRADEYPYPRGWRRLYLRAAKVQTEFFEAMFRV